MALGVSDNVRLQAGQNKKNKTKTRKPQHAALTNGVRAISNLNGTKRVVSPSTESGTEYNSIRSSGWAASSQLDISSASSDVITPEPQTWTSQKTLTSTVTRTTPVTSTGQSHYLTAARNGVVSTMMNPLIANLNYFAQRMENFERVRMLTQAAIDIIVSLKKDSSETLINNQQIAPLLKIIESTYKASEVINMTVQDNYGHVLISLGQQMLECAYFLQEYANQSKLGKYHIVENDTMQFFCKYFETIKRYIYSPTALPRITIPSFQTLRIVSDLGIRFEVFSAKKTTAIPTQWSDLKEDYLQNTQRMILADIFSWANGNDKHASRIFSVQGDRGSGKSTLVRRLADDFGNMGRLGSFFSFDHNDLAGQQHQSVFFQIHRDLELFQDRLKQEFVIPELAHNQWPPRSASQKKMTNLLRQWNSLVSYCQSGFSRTVVGPILIILEGLDLCHDPTLRAAVLSILLQRGQRELPENFKLLISSCPLKEINSSLRAGNIQVKSVENIAPHKVREDMVLYLQNRLQSLEQTESFQAKIERLVQLSEHRFQWIKMASMYINIDSNPSGRLSRLDALVSVSVKGLHELYRRVLGHIFLSKENYPPELWGKILGVILVLREALPLRILEEFLQSLSPMIPRKKTSSILGRMFLFITGFRDHKPLRINHPSFREYLIFNTGIICQSSSDHACLALASFGIMRKGLRFNLLDLETSYFPNSKTTHQVTARIGDALSYACRFWALHVGAALKEEALLVDVREELLAAIREFFTEYLLFWFEATSLLNVVMHAKHQLQVTFDWAKTDQQYRDVAALALDAIRFIDTFGQMMAHSTPHLYLSALPLTPESSSIFKSYAKKFPNVLHMTSMSLQKWPSLKTTIKAATSMAIFSGNGEWIISYSEQNNIWLWDADSGAPLFKPFRSPGAKITAIACSADGETMMSGSEYGTVRIWSLVKFDFEDLPVHASDRSSIACLSYSQDDKLLAAASVNGTIYAWNSKNSLPLGNAIRGPQGITALCFSQEQLGGQCLLSASRTGTIDSWDIRNQHHIFKITISDSLALLEINIMADSKTVMWINSSYDICVGAITGGVVTLEAERILKGHKENVQCMAVSPDQRFIVSCSSNGTTGKILLWDLSSEKGTFEVVEEIRGQATSVSFSPDSRHIVATLLKNEQILIWNIMEKILPKMPLCRSRTKSNVNIGPQSRKLSTDTIRGHSSTVTRPGILSRTSSSNNTSQTPASKKRTIQSTGSTAIADSRMPCFSANSNHRLHGYKELSQEGWVIRSRSDGWWVLEHILEEEQRLLLWVPPMYGDRIRPHQNIHLKDRGAANLDLSKYAHGFFWHNCYEKTVESDASSPIFYDRQFVASPSIDSPLI
ncbi:hypothetical protein M422DRAFT_64756 [Sphaerobolus stellatus SS14]|nr:hypothetical protein M422DRAFT_64756 [Sphaerobolus stellatus SS14]